jgi:hypothetical protein
LQKVIIKIILPMTKTSTIQFTINDLASTSKPEIKDVEAIFNYQEEFAEVLEALDELDYDVRQAVVDRIMQDASRY